MTIHTESETSQIDAARAEAFAGQMLTAVNGGFLALMMSIGHQTGLFDRLAALPPSTSSAIAAAAGLNERYVREWLGAMVTGRIIEYDPAARTYRLPPEHAACLTRAAGAGNLAQMAQFVALIGNVEQPIIEVFRKGGGLEYSAYPRFHALMAEDSAAMLDATLMSRTLPVVPGLVERLEAGIDVVDVGCGRGVAIRIMARHFPRSRFLGIDFSRDAIEWASAEAEREGLTNARFAAEDAAAFGGPPAYDFITAFDAIHDQAHPRKVLRGIREALRPDGTFLMVDIDTSSALPLHGVDHALHVGLAGIRRRGPRRLLGRGAGARAPGRSRLLAGRGAPGRGRRAQRLLHLPPVKR
jgi:2-polyprenyl-3-methyl-5-hydroxy-6-metoxy-1,4-benzoquinol methylase